MNMNFLEKRKHFRVTKMAPSIRHVIPPRHALISNLSHGGACLWVSDPPSHETALALEFRYNGRKLALPSRIVWQRTCVTDSESKNPLFADGWLVGFAFVEDHNSILITIPRNMLGAIDVAATVLPTDRPVDHRQIEAEEREQDTSGLITFSEHSVLGVKAAANELLPVFAKHFTDVHMVFTRDRLEISAPFRVPAESNPQEARRQDYRAAPANQVLQPAAPVTIEQPVAVVQPHNNPATDRRRRVLIGVATVVAMILGGSLLGVFHRPEPTRVAPDVSTEGMSIPAWAIGLDQTKLDGWIKIQQKFGMTNAEIRSAIRVLQTNDKYSAGQDLYDLTRYPAQVMRAFSLLASVKKEGASYNFGPLKNDLAGRVIQGARFPDEPPGGNYSTLQRESFNNVVVLAVIELLQRRQNDPGVKAILAKLSSKMEPGDS
jgi:PilZ domain